MRWIVRACVLLTALAAPALAFGGEKVVRVDVEGHMRPVKTYAATAPELLERLGVDAGVRDAVSPGGTLDGGDTVTVRRAKVVRLNIDGRARDVWAHGLTVGEALEGLGLAPERGDYVWPTPASHLQDGMAIVVRNALHASLRVDGHRQDVVSNAATVGGLLTQAGVKLGRLDYVRPTTDTKPADGMKIRVVRVRRIERTEEIHVPFSLVERRDSNLERGVRRISQRGSEGLTVRRYSVTLEDGERVASRLLSENVVREPRNTIVRVGTGEPHFSGTGHSDSGIASWFEADGLVAAHRTLPIGTVVKVTNLATGKSVAVRINQRGPFRDDRVIDLSDDAYSALAPLGSGTMRVKLSW